MSQAQAFAMAAACVTDSDLEAAIEAACGEAREELGGSAGVAWLFVGAPHIRARRAALASAARLACDALGTEALIGCSGSGVIGGAEESEGRPAVAVFAARLPDLDARVFHLDTLQRREAEPQALFEGLGLQAEGGPVVLLAEPFTFETEEFLGQLQQAARGLPVLGGLVSGASAPGMHVLFCGPELHNNGCVGVQLSGRFGFETLVSQGCKPIGRHAIVTRGQGPLISAVRGQSPRDWLKDVLLEIDAEDRELVRRSLLVGRVINEQQDRFERGDFLVRPILKLDAEGMVIGDAVKVGQTIQLHVRDARSAREDLEHLIAARRERLAGARGALLFTCNGRGEKLFGEPGHDTGLLRERLGGLPVGGFFCNGEIGPVGDELFLHGFTSSIGVFLEA